MKIVTQSILAAGLTLTICASEAAADMGIELKRNPFDRPAIAQLANDAQPAASNQPGTENTGLRAVLVVGATSLVDFGGVIMQVGETSNGYRLIAVQEDKAIFRKDGETITFSLFDGADGDGNEE